MNTYVIEASMPWCNSGNMSIEGEGLLYAELGNDQHGIECNKENCIEIKNKCAEILKLIREIEALNVK